MNYFILASILIASAAAQRPSYAGSSAIGVPGVAARFRPGGSLYNQAPQDVGNRFGVAVSTTERIPIDARGDVNLVNRIKTWPDENKPFWYVNAEAIEKHRGGSLNRESNVNENQPIFNGGNQGVASRFDASSSQSKPDNTGNSFNMIINNQYKTYVYDPATDAWYTKRN
ncbi:uncharacterized protein [Diabrotica undecimpunctata]|uniref:uncharacterized protein n=1 Tax=Diabrotica undecimpunctata TaxID=50387 RepID=UPI003B63704B